MADWSELKRLAEAELSLRAAGETYEGEVAWLDVRDEFMGAVDAETILALLAESEAMRQRLLMVDLIHGRKAEERWAALSAECDRRKEALERVRDRLKAAGAVLPAPEPMGTTESAMLHGLCIALALVEEELPKPQASVLYARLRAKLQEVRHG